MITQTINLNLIPGGVLPRINVSQYDKGARTLQFNLYNGVTPFTIPDGSSVYVVGTKADKTGFDYEATYTGGLVSIDVTEQMTAFAGDVEIEIRIIKSGEQIATGNFILCVERTALADDTVISETDIPIIQHLPELVAETEENAELAHKWATFGDESEEPSATNNAKYWAEQAEAAQDLTYTTVNSNPVSFTTDSSGISRDTVVTLEPIQNLHGYDHPWPAGGGKNLFDGVFTLGKNISDTGAISNNTKCAMTTNHMVVPASTQITVSARTSLHGVYVSEYTSDEQFIRRSEALNSSSITVTTSNNCHSVLVSFNYNNTDDVTNTIAQSLNLQLELGSTATSYEPYSNICPISGYTEIEVNGCGVNVWDEEWELGAIDGTDGSKVPASDRIRSANMVPVLPNEKYWFCAPSALRVRAYNTDKSFYGVLANTYNNELTMPNDVHYIMFDIANTTYNHDISINYPSTDTSYHAYTGHRITSPLPSTIYGGTYDVETGELTVDRALVDLGTLTWAYASDNAYFYTNSVTNGKDGRPLICSQYNYVGTKSHSDMATVQTGSIANNVLGETIKIKDTDYSDAATFKTAMSGVQLAYELATPYTISLEPHLLNLFEGQNNVSTNGTQISVTYRNGIVARVDDFDSVGEGFEALTGNVEIVKTDKAESSALAPVESGATASQPYAVGDYLYRNGTLYRVTSAIASGATFTVDTNITATTVMAEIVRLTQ